MKHKILSIIVPIADHLAKRGVFAPLDAELTLAIKTEAFYNKTLRRLVRSYYNGYIEEFDFIGIFAALIEGQTRRAYIEGLRIAGFDISEMTSAMWAEMDAIRRSEENYVLDFAQAVLDAKEAETGFEQFNGRIDVWTNRYPDVVNRGVLAGSKRTGVLLEWVIGETEHCDTCLSLDGTVAQPYQWDISGFRPQSPPNEYLECGGWNCQCSLVPTDKPATIPADGILSL